MNIAANFNEADPIKREAVTKILELSVKEFEVFVLKDGSVEGVSMSTRVGVSIMALELLKNVKEQWGEAELMAIFKKMVATVSDSTLEAIKQEIDNKVTLFDDIKM